MPGLAVGDAVLIHQTQRETMIICQPQQRNTAGRMFGGYLMRWMLLNALLLFLILCLATICVDAC